jgi:hypothetical protein
VPIAIGRDVDDGQQRKLVDHTEPKALEARAVPPLINYIRWASTEALSHAS